MSSQLFVPISLLLGFKNLSQMTTDKDVIIKAVEGSDKVVLSEDKTMIKPNMTPLQRTTIIIRDVPSSATEEVC